MEIKPEILYLLFAWGEEEVEGFKVIEDNIISSDQEDGGADHEYVIQEISTGKFYAGSYTDWDCDNTDYNEETNSCDDRVDFNCNLKEVKPKQKTITVYE